MTLHCCWYFENFKALGVNVSVAKFSVAYEFGINFFITHFRADVTGVDSY